MEKLTGKDLVDSHKKLDQQLKRNLDTMKKTNKTIDDNIKSLEKQRTALKGNTAATRDARGAIERLLTRMRTMKRDADNLTASYGGLATRLGGISTGFDSVGRSANNSSRGIDTFGRSIRRADRDSENLFKRFRRFLGNRGEIGKAFRDVMDFSFFRSGAVAGLNFFEAMTKILGIVPLVAVALGGLTQVLGSLATGALAAVGSIGRLTGALMVLPGLYTAFGAGMLGFSQLTKQFIQPAIEGTKELKALDKQIGAATDRLDKAKNKAKSAQDALGLREATQEDFGMDRAVSKKDAADSGALAAQGSLNDLLKQRADIIEKMPPLYEQIAKLVESITTKWRLLWQTAASPKGTLIAESLVRILKAVDKVLDSTAVKAVFTEYGRFFRVLADTITLLLANKEVVGGFMMVWRGGIRNLERIVRIFRKMAPYISAVGQAFNKVTRRALELFGWKLNQITGSANNLRINLEQIGLKGLRSFVRWVDILANFTNGFIILSRRGGLVDRFELGLGRISKNFETWAGSVNDSKLNSFFEGSWKILSAIGRLLGGIGDAFAKVLGDPKAVEETVKFLDMLSGGFSTFGEFMREAIVELGPKMTRFFETLGAAFEGEGSGLIRGIGRVVDMMTEFVAVADKLMPTGILEWVVTARVGMMGLGFAVGQVLTPMARLLGMFGGPAGLVAAFAGLTAGLGAFGKGPLARGGTALLSGRRRAQSAANIAEQGFLESERAARAAQWIQPGAGEALKAAVDLGDPAAIADARNLLDELDDDLLRATARQEGFIAEFIKADSVVEGYNKDLAKHTNIMDNLARRGDDVTRMFKNAFRWLGKMLFILTPVVAMVEAFATNFMGIRDSVKQTWQLLKDQLEPVVSSIISKLGMGTGGFLDSMFRILEAINKINLVMGYVLIKVVEIVALMSAPFLKVFLKGIEFALDRFSDLADAIEAIFSPKSAAELAYNFGKALVNSLLLVLSVGALVAAFRLVWMAVGTMLGVIKGTAMATATQATLLLKWNVARMVGLLGPRFAAIGASLGITMGGALSAAVAVGMASIPIAGAIAVKAIFDNYDKQRAEAVAKGRVDAARTGEGQRATIMGAREALTNKDFIRPKKKQNFRNIPGAGRRVGVYTGPTQAKDEIGAEFRGQAKGLDLDQLREDSLSLEASKNALLDRIEENAPSTGRLVLNKVLSPFTPKGGPIKAGPDIVTQLEAQVEGIEAESSRVNTLLTRAGNLKMWNSIPEFNRLQANRIREIKDQLLGSDNRLISLKSDVRVALANGLDVQSDVVQGIFENIAKQEDKQRELKDELGRARANALTAAAETYDEAEGFSKVFAMVNLQIAMLQADKIGADNIALADVFLDRTALRAQATASSDKKKLGAAIRAQMGGSEDNDELFSRIIGGEEFKGNGKASREIRRRENLLSGSDGPGGDGGAGLADASAASSTVANMVGFSENVPGEGAVMKFSKGPLGKYLTDMKKIQTRWSRLAGKAKQGLWDMKKVMKNQQSSVRARAKGLADAISGPFDALFGQNGTFYTWLDDAKTAANEILTATGQPKIGDGASGGPVASGGTTTGSVSPAANDSTTGATLGQILNAGALSELAGGLESSATNLLMSIPGVKTLSSVALGREGDRTSSGQLSQHSTGNAMDFTMGTKSEMSAAGKMIQSIGAAYGVDPSQVFYPGAGAAGLDHEDHVHVGFSGTGSGAGILSQIPEVPDFGSGPAGSMASGMANMVFNALNSMMGGALGGGNGGSAPMAPTAIEEMINSAAGAYGANAAGLKRVAFAESGYDVNAYNDYDSNFQAGTPSRGLFQFIESTFASYASQARDAAPGAWSNTPMEWLNPRAQSLTAAWAFANGKSGDWATAAQYGDGGQFTANKPTPIIVGDKQPEEVRVTPTRGPNKGKYSGGSTTVINSTINLGTLIADDEGIAELTDKIGEQFRSDLKTARSFHPNTEGSD